MFKIRQEQMDAFKPDLLRRFEERVAVHVRESCAEETAALSEEDLGRCVHEAVQRARGYGIEREDDVVDFVEWTFELGPRFELEREYSWALTILQDPQLDGEAKVVEIADRLEEEGPVEEEVEEGEEDEEDDQDVENEEEIEEEEDEEE